MSDYEKCAGYQLNKSRIESHEAIDQQKDIEQETIIMSINKRMDKLEDKVDELKNDLQDFKTEIPRTIQKVITDLYNEISGKIIKWFFRIIFIGGAGGGIIALIKMGVLNGLLKLFGG